MKCPKYKIGDEFYIVIQEDCDCEYYAIYKGIVCGYSCSIPIVKKEKEYLCKESGFNISFYKTLILNCYSLKYHSLKCYSLKKFIEKNNILSDIEEGDPHLRLEYFGVPGRFINESHSLVLDINTEKEKEMHTTVYDAIECMGELYDEQHNDE